jgi:tetratricopeptide (TPR) repeat protein
MLKQNRLFLFLFFLIMMARPASGQVNDSISILERSLSGNLPDDVKLNTLVRLADLFVAKKATMDTAESYTTRAFEFARQKKLPIPYRLRWIHAIILRSHDNPVKAADEMNLVIAYLVGENKYQEAAKARNYLAAVTAWSGNMNQSLDIYLENIKYAREKNLKSIIPGAYIGMAGLYNVLKNFKEEKNHLQLALDEAKKENNPELTAGALDKLGRSYSTVDSNYFAAILYFHEALKIRKALKDSIQIFWVLNSLGWNFYLARQQDSSLYYYFLSLQLCPRSHISGFANIYENVGNIYRDKKDFKNALHYYNLCNDYCLKADDIYNRAWLNKDMSDMYISMGDYKSAYQHFVTFTDLNNLLNNRKYDLGLADARTRYETEGKEKELQLLTLRLNQHQYLAWGFAGLIAMLLIIGFLLYYQAKLSAKKKISEMNHKLSEITHANLRQQMNPHFIFNTLNSIQYYMYQHDKIATNNYLTKFSRLIRKILENSQQTMVPVKDELDVIQLYLELETLRFKEKFTYEIIIDEEIDTLTYKIPTMLIQPYVENAVCHGLINKPDQGELTITMQLCDHHICCTVEDNGIGREAAMEIRKQKDTPHSSLGTKITESRIHITNALYGTDLKVIFTDLKDTADNPCGTRVELHLPLMT